MITVPADILTELVAHARECAPVEACGLLAGNGKGVVKCYRFTNVDASPEHFSLDPKEQFAAVKDMRAEGIEMLAVYHSHPASPARMSDEDLRLAFTPGIQYVIVSLLNGDKPEVRAFEVEDGRVVAEQTLLVEKL